MESRPEARPPHPKPGSPQDPLATIDSVIEANRSLGGALLPLHSHFAPDPELFLKV